jgi:hypothetical protein
MRSTFILRAHLQTPSGMTQLQPERCIRFTWRQLREEPELVVARLAAALAQP